MWVKVRVLGQYEQWTEKWILADAAIMAVELRPRKMALQPDAPLEEVRLVSVTLVGNLHILVTAEEAKEKLDIPLDGEEEEENL